MSADSPWGPRDDETRDPDEHVAQPFAQPLAQPLPLEPAPEPLPVDPHYEAAWNEVLRSGKAKSTWVLAAILIGTLALFVLSLAGNFDAGALATLLGVVLVHEAGHYAGMKYFGFSDVKMFFIPFFGAAVSGEKHAAPAWQQCVVTLLGPLPGIFAAALIYALARPAHFEPAGAAVLMLLVLNAVNLLPVEPLDGGRFLNRALFSRHPIVELIFLLLTALALGWIGWFLELWILTGLAGVGFLTAFYRYRVARMGRLVQHKLPDLPADLAALDDAERLALYEIARSVHLTHTDPKLLAATIKSLHHSAVVRPPSLAATAGLVLLYFAGWVAAIGTAVFMTIDMGDLGGDAAVVRDYQRLVQEMDECDDRLAVLSDEADDLAQLAQEAKDDPVRANNLRAEEDRLRNEVQVLSDRVQALQARIHKEFEVQFDGRRMVVHRRGPVVLQ